jgi:hypothetical protein
MTPAEYRAKAALLLEQAQAAEPDGNREIVTIALRYLRLADMAEKNSRNDVVYETPSGLAANAATTAAATTTAGRDRPAQNGD